MGYPITDIEGIGPRFATKLKKAVINNTDRLLKDVATKKGRKSVATATGLEEKQILKWTNMADLMRVRGVGEEYSELLEAAGVDTVKELRNRKSENLQKKMVEVNKKKKLVRQIPGPGQVQKWVAHAKKLKPVMTY